MVNSCFTLLSKKRVVRAKAYILDTRKTTANIAPPTKALAVHILVCRVDIYVISLKFK